MLLYPKPNDFETMTPFERYINLRSIILREVRMPPSVSAKVWPYMNTLPFPYLAPLVRLRTRVELARKTPKGRWDRITKRNDGYDADDETERPSNESNFELVRRCIHIGAYDRLPDSLKRKIWKYICTKFSQFQKLHLKNIIKLEKQGALMDIGMTPDFVAGVNLFAPQLF